MRVPFFKLQFAIAAVAVVAPGCQTGAIGIDPSDAGAPGNGLDLTGRWAMFAFEDPVAVDIHGSGGAIEGQGCCGGFSAKSGQFGCCGAVTGTMADRRASFGFSFDFGGEPYTYSTESYVSSDGKRMGGRFSRIGWPVAWVRIASTDATLPPADPAIQEVIDGRSGSYALVLADDPAPGSDFSAHSTYHLNTGRFVFGDLGAFWGGEMSWSAADQTLAVGPVPETAPGLPVALWLHFDGTTLVFVEAAMASGVRYHFRATVPPP